MSKEKIHHEKISVELIDRIIQNFVDIQNNHRQKLRHCLLHAEVHTMCIRQNIIEQGKKFTKGVLILQGTLLITKKLAHGKIVLSQLNPLQIANIQIYLYEKVYYNVSVYSSQVKFIYLPQDILYILFNYFKDVIVQKQHIRNLQINAKINEVSTLEKKKYKDKIINHLSFPIIKYYSKEFKTLNPETMQRRKQFMSLDREFQELFPLKKPTRSQPRLAPTLVNERQQKITLNKSKKVRLNINRNEKLFQQRIKAIMKRKLIYQQRQLRNVQECIQDKARQTFVNKNEDIVLQNGSQIDQYFNI